MYSFSSVTFSDGSLAVFCVDRCTYEASEGSVQISLTELGSERLDVKNLARREGLHFSDID